MSFAKEVWDTLSKIDVSGHVEKKDGLTYLSWAWAWGELKRHYPEATYVIHQDEGGKPYIKDDIGYMCYVTVSIGEISYKMWLPVMNHKNKAMKSEPYTYKVWNKYKKQYEEQRVEAATMFDVNKTIMRCLVKCIAMFGLGHYIYAGEDLPQASEDKIEPPKEYAGDGSGLQAVPESLLDDLTNLYQQEDDLGLWCMRARTPMEQWGTLRGGLGGRMGKGSKTKGMKKLDELIDLGENKVVAYTEEMKKFIANDDQQGIEELKPLPVEVKKAINNDLTEEERLRLRG